VKKRKQISQDPEVTRRTQALITKKVARDLAVDQVAALMRKALAQMVRVQAPVVEVEVVQGVTAIRMVRVRNQKRRKGNRLQSMIFQQLQYQLIRLLLSKKLCPY
jgi:hypothetical protein